MITVRVRDRDVYAIPLWPITTGSVGLPVAFDFDKAWDGLTRIAVFRGSDTDVEVALLTDACVVPPEVLTVAGGNLYIGVYGRDAYGTVVIPTIWGKAGHIYDGTEPEDPDPTDPTPEWSYQVQQAAAEALRIAQGVAADAEAGEFDGVSPEVSVTETTDGHVVTITDRDGDHSFNVPNGATGPQGPSGYSPTVTVTDITGGHRVTITDANGAHTFDVMDGEDGSGGGSITVDGALSDSSTNPVQNKVIKAALDGKGTYSKPSSGIPASDLAAGVIPTVPTKTSDLINDSGFITEADIDCSLSDTAIQLLETVLRAAIYSSNQSGNITALIAALNGGTPDPDPDPEPTEDVTLSDGVLTIISTGATATLSSSVLTIA